MSAMDSGEKHKMRFNSNNREMMNGIDTYQITQALQNFLICFCIDISKS